MLRVEFHCHTRLSKDSLLSPEGLLAACRRKQIDRVVITDHNTIAGALIAKQLDPTRVIIGEEILTQDGELLAAYVTEEVPRGLPAAETIARLREQGAFISVSHPFDVMRSGHWEADNLLRILPLVDAIETFLELPPGTNLDMVEHEIFGTIERRLKPCGSTRVTENGRSPWVAG